MYSFKKYSQWSDSLHATELKLYDTNPVGTQYLKVVLRKNKLLENNDTSSNQGNCECDFVSSWLNNYFADCWQVSLRANYIFSPAKLRQH